MSERLTREQVEECRRWLTDRGMTKFDARFDARWNALCDMALSAPQPQREAVQPLGVTGEPGVFMLAPAASAEAKDARWPDDPAMAMGKLFPKLDQEDFDTINWMLKAARAAGKLDAALSREGCHDA